MNQLQHLFSRKDKAPSVIRPSPSRTGRMLVTPIRERETGVRQQSDSAYLCVFYMPLSIYSFEEMFENGHLLDDLLLEYLIGPFGDWTATRFLILMSKPVVSATRDIFSCLSSSTLRLCTTAPRSFSIECHHSIVLAGDGEESSAALFAPASAIKCLIFV